MVLSVMLAFFAPGGGVLIGWILIRHSNPDTQRKRGEILLVLAPCVFAALLFIGYLISR